MPLLRHMDSTIVERLQMMSIQIVPFFAAIVFHEFGHGWMANKWGDKTAFESGRLTLNPIPHIDPIGTVAIPIINMVTGIPLLFGWAKPVPINPTRFKKYRPGLFWVSLAGPGFNVLLAIISALVLGLWVRFTPQSFFLFEPIQHMMAASISINYALAIFNLVPLPPLDGARIVDSFLPYNASRKFAVLEQYSFWILLALLWSGTFTLLSGPITTLTHMTLNLTALVYGAL